VAGSGTAHLRDGAILSVKHLFVAYTAHNRGKVQAVSDLSLDVLKGETLGLVGESGCGKSTTALAILRHIDSQSGEVCFDGVDLRTLEHEALRRTRIKLQMIFQDPISSLNPRKSAESIIGEGPRIWGMGTASERAEKVREVMEAVGLTYDPSAKRRRGEFSGGQCQRISIARALILDPEVVVCDEPVSSLDVSVQAQILNLLADMRQRYGLTLLFIAHDLAVVKHISDRIAVMYLGKMCEVASAELLYREPRHPYTSALLGAIPLPDPGARGRRPDTAGRVTESPSPSAPPSGCRFRLLCPRAQQRCADEEPTIRAMGPDHYVACHFPLNNESESTVHRSPHS
jgi:peptide/nickel transport system ATP-binding protein